MNDLISRQAAIEVAMEELESGTYFDIPSKIKGLPSEQPMQTNTHNALTALDCISRQDAIDALYQLIEARREWLTDARAEIAGIDAAICEVADLPSVQPERTCVNCGRTVNNGGWYADGRTRCPIEEHYALPKDGYCHLWEKRNVTDDDYPERRTDE